MPYMPGVFPHHHLSPEECDVLMREHVALKYQKTENELASGRWLDYWRLHPFQATELFFQEYKAAYAGGMEIRGRPNVRPFKGNPQTILSLKSRERHIFWKARQAADGMGVPYGFYLRSVMRIAEERSWRYLPRPNALYGEEMRLMIQQLWHEELSCRLILPGANVVLAAQSDAALRSRFHDYLIYILRVRGVPRFTIRQFVWVERLLPEDIARAQFGDEAVGSPNSQRSPFLA